MAYDYTAELQAAYEAELAKFQPVPAQPSTYGHDLTTSRPRGSSDKEIAEGEIGASIAYARNAGVSPQEIEDYYGLHWSR